MKKPPDYKILSSFKEKNLFLTIIIIEFLQLIYWVLSNRLVVHDTFFRFYMQYYYLNNYVNYLEFPYWIPYLTHGTLATPWQGLVGIHGFLNNTLFLTGSILKNVNFLSIFYMGVFFDRIILLTGTWLLSRRFYNSPVVSFFVTVSVLVSSVWASQIHLNFLFYYAVPLIIYLLHQFIETQKWRYFLLALNLFMLQSIDKLFYFLPVVSLSIGAYFFFYFVFNSREMMINLRKIKFNRHGIISIVLVLISILAVFSLVKIGMDGEIVKNILQRNEDGSVPLNVFLTYSQDNGITKWLEIILGISIKNDNTLYCGLLIPLFALFALLFNSNRKSLPLLLTALLLFLFSLGTIVSIFFYYYWPTMKFYRHIFQIVSIVRLFLCFLAGFGFLKFFELIFSKNRPHITHTWLIVTVSCLFMGGVIVFTQADKNSFVAALMKPLIYDADLNQIFRNSSLYYSFFRFLGIKYIICSLLLISFWFFEKKSLEKMVFLLIVFHVLDGYSYSLQEFNNRTVVLSQKQLQITRFQPMTFNHRRTSDDFSKDSYRIGLLTPNLLSKSILSWNIHAFLFTEPFHSQLRTDHWLKPYAQYTKTDSLGSDIVRDKFSGVTENKIQFFREAYCADSDRTSKIMALPEYTGDSLFLECLPEDPPVNGALNKNWNEQTTPTANDRLFLTPTIKSFSSNRINLEIFNPNEQPIWLFYSDVWHPFWKAKVNHKRSPVYKANIAYKAILLNPGPNDVLFYFSATPWGILTFLIILNSFFWLCYIIYLLKTLISGSNHWSD